VEEEYSRTLFPSEEEEEECRRILSEVEEEEEEAEEECRRIILEEEEEVDLRFHVYICNVSSYCLFYKIAYDIPDNSQSCHN
jgi:predicted Ser/Thr protein kinase